jgi:hypothetical protein
VSAYVPAGSALAPAAIDTVTLAVAFGANVPLEGATLTHDEVAPAVQSNSSVPAFPSVYVMLAGPTTLPLSLDGLTVPPSS